MKYINYTFASFLLFFTPVKGSLIAVGIAIAFDTISGIFKTIKLHGRKSFNSRTLSNVISKMFLYNGCVLSLFIMDYFLLNEFAKEAFGFEYMVTKACAIVLMTVELVSIRENIEQALNIDIWAMLKKIFNRAKEIKSDINEITK